MAMGPVNSIANGSLKMLLEAYGLVTNAGACYHHRVHRTCSEQERVSSINAKPLEERFHLIRCHQGSISKHNMLQL